MAFTNVFDVSEPPDTQPALNLGLDIRKFKLDVQERIAKLSGLDADKPDYSLDAQPANWTGTPYFATDTHKVFRWSGAAWTDVTASIFVPPVIPVPSTVVVDSAVVGDMEWTITIGAIIVKCLNIIVATPGGLAAGSSYATWKNFTTGFPGDVLSAVATPDHMVSCWIDNLAYNQINIHVFNALSAPVFTDSVMVDAIVIGLAA